MSGRNSNFHINEGNKTTKIYGDGFMLGKTKDPIPNDRLTGIFSNQDTYMFLILHVLNSQIKGISDEIYL